MTIKTRIAALAVAALTVAGGIASATKAEAHGFNPGSGFAARLVGAAIVDSAIAASTPARFYRSCLIRQYDVLGRYVGTVNVCY